MSTGNLMADCERWCRDNLPRRVEQRQETTTLRVVPPLAEPAPRRPVFRPGPGWPGVEVARTGS
ncbi:hypothetical protein DQ241_05020 [Blastococcus sp. TF02A-30]|nr:hypothetical protein DQ241_05020 [Blastococcus sp. TF02A-30]